MTVGARLMESPMRRPLRLLAPILAVAVLVLGGASSALAAASPSTASLDASWCFDDLTRVYCFEVTGTVNYLVTKLGSSANIHEITRTTFYEAGQYIGESKDVTADRFFFGADGTVVMHSVANTRSTLGDEACTYHMVLRIANYEAVVDHVASTCGG
jgi:hypothetical protein